MSLDDRFWSKVDETEGGCWLWTAYINRNGYGMFRLGRMQLAHRVAYEDAKGPIPEGLTIDHLCRVRACVNPDHLEAVTIGENIRRGINYDREKTHCPQGHSYDEENTYRHRGHRYCKECRRKRNRRRYWERKTDKTRSTQ